MEKMINTQNFSSYAYVNDEICKKPFQGMLIFFQGLGGSPIDTLTAEYFAEHGILYVHPYYAPWSWMNDKTVAYTDEIVDALFLKYDLPEDFSIISTGKSMGGLASLVYTAKAARTPIACIANCPVCNAVYHFSERDDLPKTMYQALYDVPGSLEEALSTISPIHLAEKMPKISYHIFHCGNDQAVNINCHSIPFVEKMRTLGHKVTFDLVPGRRHCDLGYLMQKRFCEYALQAIESVH